MGAVFRQNPKNLSRIKLDELMDVFGYPDVFGDGSFECCGFILAMEPVPDLTDIFSRTIKR